MSTKKQIMSNIISAFRPACGSAIAIGLDETKYIRKDSGTFNQKISESKSYALWHDGDKNKWDHPGIIKAKDDGLHFNANDTVSMILDLSSRTISYQINENKKFDDVFTNIAVGNDIKYCMCVYIHISGWGIQLIQCDKL